MIKDPQGLLVQPTENSQAQRQMRFTSLAQVTKLKSTVKDFVKQAIANEKAGLEVTYKKTHEFPVPEELQAKFDESPALKRSFDALTPGRQRGYLFHFNAAKQSATRAARIERAAPAIFKGKGFLERR